MVEGNIKAGENSGCGLLSSLIQDHGEREQKVVPTMDKVQCGKKRAQANLTLQMRFKSSQNC